jgi:hypothetical protein
VSQHLYEEHASPTVPNPRDNPGTFSRLAQSVDTDARSSVYERYQDGFARDKTKHIN